MNLYLHLTSRVELSLFPLFEQVLKVARKRDNEVEYISSIDLGLNFCKRASFTVKVNCKKYCLEIGLLRWKDIPEVR